MKNTLKFIGNIFKKKMMKRLLWIIILLGVSGMFLANNKVVADPQIEASKTTNKTEEDKFKNMSEVNEVFTYISNAVYALLWPVLFITWTALDNRLVYWSFLHLDASLWALWNIMKNFANFALWFLVLFAIVRNIFTWPFGGKTWEKRWPISIIKKTLIAGVLIQASWFLVAAVVDLSTILTYSIWWLPITVSQNNPQQKDQPILWVKAVINTKWPGWNNKMSLQYYNTYWDVNISPCYTTNKIYGLTWTYIVWRKQIRVNAEQKFISSYCTLWWWPYHYKENEDYLNFSASNEEYTIGLQEYFEQSPHDPGHYLWLLDECKIIPVDSSKLSESCIWYWFLTKDDAFFKNASENNKIKYTLTNILEKSKWFVGPFITIYSSLLNFSDLAEPASWSSIVWDFLDLIIKLFFAFVLFIPLLVLAIVLVIRIWLLRLIIAASPVLVLLAVFKQELNIKWGGEGIMAYFDWAQIVKLVFAPVFIVFAISMSMIFLSALNNRVDKHSWLSDEQFEKLLITKNENSFSFLWLMEIELDMERINKWMDMLSWFITMFFATWIMRFFLFFAIRMTKIWDKIWKWFQESTQNLVKNLPIIPIGWSGVGIKAAKEWLDKLWSVVPDRLNRQQTDHLKKRFPWLYPGVADASRGFDKIRKPELEQILADIRSIWINETFEKHKPTLSSAEIATKDWLLRAYNDYVLKNMDKIETIVAKPDETISSDGIATYNVENLLIDTVEEYLNSDKWKDLAEKAIWKNIITYDGVRVVVNIWNVLEPKYKLLTEQEYDKKYLFDVTDSNGNFVEEKLRQIIEDQIKDDKQPDEMNESDRNKKRQDRINTDLEAHKKYAKERLESSPKKKEPNEPGGQK